MVVRAGRAARLFPLAPLPFSPPASPLNRYLYTSRRFFLEMSMVARGGVFASQREGLRGRGGGQVGVSRLRRVLRSRGAHARAARGRGAAAAAWRAAIGATAAALGAGARGVHDPRARPGRRAANATRAGRPIGGERERAEATRARPAAVPRGGRARAIAASAAREPPGGRSRAHTSTPGKGGKALVGGGVWACGSPRADPHSLRPAATMARTKRVRP